MVRQSVAPLSDELAKIARVKSLLGRVWQHIKDAPQRGLIVDKKQLAQIRKTHGSARAYMGAPGSGIRVPARQ